MRVQPHEHGGASLAIDGRDTLEVRERYLKSRRRRPLGRAAITMWVSVSALIGWLFIVAFTVIEH
jgi:hypothetical protein